MSRNMDWAVDGACRPNPAWTTERRPAEPVEDAMRAICRSCPVIAKCAAHALQTGVQGAFYAGVWIPSRGNHYARDAARRVLKRKAEEAA